MQSHRSLLAGLATSEREALLRLSNTAGLWHLAGHAGALFVTGLLITLKVPFWPLLLLPHGLLAVFGFCAMHESLHKTAFRSAWINDAVAGFVGFYLLLPARWFRHFHFAHHRHTGDPARDPELESPAPETIGHYLHHLTGLPLWWSRLVKLAEIGRGRITDDFIPARQYARIKTETRCYLAGYSVLLALSLGLQSGILIWLWLVPVVLGQPFLRAYLLAEHTGCPQGSNMLLNSRTTKTNAIMLRLAWNMPYHVEHHAFPAVPFFRLPAFHNRTKAHIGTLQSGYLNFHRQLVKLLKRPPPQLQRRS